MKKNLLYLFRKKIPHLFHLHAFGIREIDFHENFKMLIIISR